MTTPEEKVLERFEQECNCPYADADSPLAQPHEDDCLLLHARAIVEVVKAARAFRENVDAYRLGPVVLQEPKEGVVEMPITLGYLAEQLWWALDSLANLDKEGE
jgi:hypothetical protein